MINKFEFPKLEYEYDSLEPFIDARTMEIHHSKHHQTYVDKLNAVISGKKEFEHKSAEEVVADLPNIPDDIRTAVRNYGGGVVNHKFFFSILKKDVGISGEIKETIERKFGSFEEFKKKFKESALNLFGSGWTWLVLNKKRLEIMNTANQDSPLSEDKIPLLVIDLWEHAYYLKYQNRRAEYIDNFFNIINWGRVNEYFVTSIRKLKGVKNERN